MIDLGSLSDQWETPRWLFNKLNKEFNFDIDVCATYYNNKCARFIDKEINCLDVGWEGRKCFMNPPYSNAMPFIKKAWEESKNNLVICLLKVDPSTRWWSVFWDYETQQPKAGCRIRYVTHPKNSQLGCRVKFDPPPKHILENYLENGSDKDKKLAIRLLDDKITTPAFPSVEVIMDRRFLNY